MTVLTCKLPTWLNGRLADPVQSRSVPKAVLAELPFLTQSIPAAKSDPKPPVFTLDSDFRVYRRNKRQSLPLICP